MKKIGIVTWHYYGNFGSALQAFALQEAITQQGYDAEFVNYHDPKFGRFAIIKDALMTVADYSLGCISSRFRNGRIRFSNRYLHCSEPTTDAKRLPKMALKYDTIVCGADQIWAPNVFNPIYFASFANQGQRKVSYAASIGLNKIPINLIDKYKCLLEDFTAISVREDEGKILLRESCSIESQVVLDPTLLFDATFYKRIQRPVPDVKGKYLFCYFLNENHQYKERVEKYAKENGLKIVGFSSNIDDLGWMQKLTRLGADNFIWLINHAEAVMTDSYHGTIFSLLFHKPFWTFVRFAEDSPICQNSRIRQLQCYFGNNVRVIGSHDEIDANAKIDYNEVDARIKVLRQESLDFLKTSLQ